MEDDAASETSLKKLTATLVAKRVEDDMEELARPKCKSNWIPTRKTRQEAKKERILARVDKDSGRWRHAFNEALGIRPLASADVVVVVEAEVFSIFSISSKCLTLVSARKATDSS